MSDTIPDGGGFDDERTAAESTQTVTTDAVAGETVFPGTGSGNNGPTGGAPGEATPELGDNDLEGDEIVGLDDDGDDPTEARS